MLPEHIWIIQFDMLVLKIVDFEQKFSSLLYFYLNICPYVEICAIFLFFIQPYYCVTTGDFFLHPLTVPKKKFEIFRHPSIQVCVALWIAYQSRDSGFSLANLFPLCVKYYVAYNVTLPSLFF